MGDTLRPVYMLPNSCIVMCRLQVYNPRRLLDFSWTPCSSRWIMCSMLSSCPSWSHMLPTKSGWPVGKTFLLFISSNQQPTTPDNHLVADVMCHSCLCHLHQSYVSSPIYQEHMLEGELLIKWYFIHFAIGCLCLFVFWHFDIGYGVTWKKEGSWLWSCSLTLNGGLIFQS